MHADRKARVLIVDDNYSLARTTGLILARKGYAAAIARDGLEAVAAVQERPFDVILMDIKMPVMNGVETYKKIKHIRPEAVVIMMTAYALEDLVQEALEEGAYAVIYKPLDIEKVIALFEEARTAKRSALILVVDDDEGTCINLSKILAKRGYQVGIAYTGEEAIALAHERDHDILIIDLKLPTINGLETYLAIKEINPEAVAVLMTAYRQEVSALVEEALRNNAYTCLYKPLEIEDLLRLVREIWERRKIEMKSGADEMDTGP